VRFLPFTLQLGCPRVTHLPNTSSSICFLALRLQRPQDRAFQGLLSRSFTVPPEASTTLFAAHHTSLQQALPPWPVYFIPTPMRPPFASSWFRITALLFLLLTFFSSSLQQDAALSSAAYNFWGAYEQEVGEWVVSLFSQGISLYNSFGSVRYSSRAQAARCIDRLAKQAKSMDAIEVFRDTRVKLPVSHSTIAAVVLTHLLIRYLRGL
jgi:hypothetical protein